MSGYLIDTHVWIWLIEDSAALSQAVKDLLLEWQRSGTLYLSAISAWEVSQKQSKGKLDVAGDVEEWVQLMTRPGYLKLIDVSVHDLVAANRLPGEIHGDPADRILAATAREHALVLVTHDTPLLNYAKQGHLRVYKV